MSSEIYYFSGTGNSFSVAKDIAEKIGASLIPIARLADKELIETNAETIGIVFPVYYGELPVIVRRFAVKLGGLSDRYIFAVATYGGAAMASLRILKRVIRSSGNRLSAAFGIHMPQNSFYKPREVPEKLCSDWKSRLDHVAGKIMKKAIGTIYNDPLLELLVAPVHPVVIRPKCRKAFAEMTGMPGGLKLDELTRRLDTGLFTDEKCRGCGTCARVCPVSNIVMRDNKPVWLHQCENCLACYNWCPNRAIGGGITPKGYYYHHADVDITDIMKQKSGLKNQEKK